MQKAGPTQTIGRSSWAEGCGPVRGGAPGSARHWLRQAGETRVSTRKRRGRGDGAVCRGSCQDLRGASGAMIRNGHGAAGAAGLKGPASQRTVRVWCDGW